MEVRFSGKAESAGRLRPRVRVMGIHVDTLSPWCLPDFVGHQDFSVRPVRFLPPAGGSVSLHFRLHGLSEPSFRLFHSEDVLKPSHLQHDGSIEVIGQVFVRAMLISTPTTVKPKTLTVLHVLLRDSLRRSCRHRDVMFHQRTFHLHNISCVTSEFQS